VSPTIRRLGPHHVVFTMCSEPEVRFADITTDLPEPRFWPTSGVPTIRESLTISAFLGTNPTDDITSSK
jgi:hypothetical protein